MVRITVARLSIPFHVADHIWERHHIDTEQVRSLNKRRYVVTRNHRRAATPYLLIGEDEQGRCITVPVAPTDDPLTWRVASAWYCNADDARKLDR
jgi:hypothetical protein